MDGTLGTCSTATACYSYDAFGRRTEKVTAAAKNDYLHDLSGRPIGEWLNNGSYNGWAAGYIYAGGQLLAEYKAGTTYFVHGDHLGSTRLVTGVGSNLILNPGFESGLTNWTTGNVVTLITDSTRAHSGSNYAQLSAPVNSSATVVGQNLAVQPGDVITYGGWAYLESGGGSLVGWGLQAENSSQVGIAWYAASPMASTGSGWIFQSGTYTVPSSGVAYVELFGQVWNATGTTVLRVDDGFLYDNRTSLQIVQNLDYLPYGELLLSNSGATTHMFTGDERDAETNLDHTQFRKYSSNLGRWMTPDPAGLAAVDPTNPQSWNRYAYVLNNPLNLLDPFGLDCQMYDILSEDYYTDDTYSGDPAACSEAGGYWEPDPNPGTYFDGSNPPQGSETCISGIDGAGCEDNSFGSAGGSDSWDFSSLFNFSFWDLLKNPISGSAITPVYAFGPAASAGVGVTGAYNPRTDTGCYGIAVAAMVPAGGRSLAVGPLTVGNLSNADNILAGGSVFVGAQASPGVGVQVMGNSSGILAGPTLSNSEGIVVGPSYSACQPNVVKRLFNWAINNLVP